MSKLRQIWNDIRQGENIDLYLSVIAAVLLATLNLLGIAPQSWLASITLTILALLAISGLGNRHKMDAIFEKLNQSTDTVFLDEFPNSLKENFNKSKEMLLIGYTLAHTISSNYPILESKLKNGDKVKILVLNPDGLSCKLTVSRIYRPIDERMYRTAIRTTLHDLCTLKTISPNSLEIRTLDQPFAFGFLTFDINTNNGKIYLEHYPIKMPGDVPKIVLSAKDGRWYQFFKEQALNLWNSGTPWECSDNQKTG